MAVNIKVKALGNVSETVQFGRPGPDLPRSILPSIFLVP